jgi:hypothetical protein
MDEISRGSLKPLHDSHCESHADRESRRPDALHLMFSAAELRRKLLPCEPAFAPTRIQTVGERGEIPA